MNSDGKIKIRYIDGEIEKEKDFYNLRDIYDFFGNKDRKLINVLLAPKESRKVLMRKILKSQ